MLKVRVEKRFYPAVIYLLKVNNRNTRTLELELGLKYVQS